MTRQGLTFAAALLLAGCVGSGDSDASRTVWVADGSPVNCISTNQIRAFRVIDDRTIDFERNRSTAWRNSLPLRCDGLSFDEKIRMNNRTSQLCSFDSITPVSMGSDPNAMRCQLGQFQPMKRVPMPEAPATPGG